MAVTLGWVTSRFALLHQLVGFLVNRKINGIKNSKFKSSFQRPFTTDCWFLEWCDRLRLVKRLKRINISSCWRAAAVKSTTMLNTKQLLPFRSYDHSTVEFHLSARELLMSASNENRRYVALMQFSNHSDCSSVVRTIWLLVVWVVWKSNGKSQTSLTPCGANTFGGSRWKLLGLTTYWLWQSAWCFTFPSRLGDAVKYTLLGVFKSMLLASFFSTRTGKHGVPKWRL